MLGYFCLFFIFKFIDTRKKRLQFLTQGNLTGKIADRLCGCAEQTRSGRHRFGYAGLCAKLGPVAHGDVSGETYLTANHHVAANFCRPGNTCLGRHYGILPHFHIVGNLDKVVELNALMDTCSAHYGTVDRSVGSYLYIIGYFHYTHLRNLMEHTVGIGGKAESVGAYHRARMYHTSRSDTATVIDFHTGVYDCIIANLYIRANICLGIYLDVFAYAASRAYVCKCAHIYSFGELYALCDKRWLLNATRHVCCGTVYHVEEHSHCGIRVVDTYQCCFHRMLCHEIAAYEHC